MSPKVWHPEHDESSRLDVRVASYRKLRPFFTTAGSGLNIVTCAASVNDCVLTTEIPLSKRVSTYARARDSSSTTPVGPPPLRTSWFAADGVNVLASSCAVSKRASLFELIATV